MQAKVMPFRQLKQTALEIYTMHNAVEESRRAAHIRGALGARLDSIRSRLPEVVGAIPATSTSEAVQRATAGEGRPIASPLPTRSKPRSNEPMIPSERSVEL